MGSSKANAGSAHVPRNAVMTRATRHNHCNECLQEYPQPRLGPSLQSVSVHTLSQSADRLDCSTFDQGTAISPIHSPPDNFKHSLTFFSNSFSFFPRGTCLLSISG
ncbi:hypothetical protein K1719_026550 [Acacia pycnantha]|nr:hypothetical protein K1719_026550 [Acacia pycnantha]